MSNGRSHRNQRNQEETITISKELWIGRKEEVKGEGKGNKKKEAEKNAKLNFNDNLKKKLSENSSLTLSKLIPIVLRENGNITSKLIDKKDLLEAIIEKQNNLLNCKEIFDKIKTALDNANISLEGFDKIIDNQRFTTTSRLVCGLGSASVLETSITLHHIWGITYIPGSSFKGVCREVVFKKLVETKKISEDKLNEFQDKFYGELCVNDSDILAYQLLFGAQNFKGLLLFLDAYPDINNNESIFDLDIMNPHYSRYYSDNEGKIPPGDWENPVPIFFLTVKKGVAFKFTVLFDRWRWEKIEKEGMKIKRNDKTFTIKFIEKEKNEIEKNVISIDKTKVTSLIENKEFYEMIIKQALNSYGIGSKRSLGYGYFKI